MSNPSPTTVPGPFVGYTHRSADLTGQHSSTLVLRTVQRRADDQPTLCIPLNFDGSIPEEVVLRAAKSSAVLDWDEYNEVEQETLLKSQRAALSALSSGLSQEDRGT